MDAHEARSEENLVMEHGSGFTRQEHTNMDFHNNAVGRDCVKWFEFYLSDDEISDRVLEKLRNGELTYIVNHGWYNGILECTSTQ